MATDIKKLAEELVNLTVLEVNELKTVLKDEYGIEPVAAVAVAAAGADGAAADEGKSEYDVVLKDAGAQKIAVIKAVKEATSKLFRDLKSCLLRHAKRIALELPQLLLISHLIEHIHNGSKLAILLPSPFSGYFYGRRGRQAILIAYTVK